MAGFNETTAQILELLEEGPCTVKELLKELGCSRSNIQMILFRLLKKGRVARETQTKGAVVIRKNPPVSRPKSFFVYTITEAGRKRLERMQKEE